MKILPLSLPEPEASRVAKSLLPLLQAYDEAREAGYHPWDAAVEFVDLHSCGATYTDLHCLVLAGCLEHGIKRKRKNAAFRPSTKSSPHQMAFPEGTCFMLTEQGALFVRQHTVSCPAHGASNEQPEPSVVLPLPLNRPHWNPLLKELHVGALLVKAFLRSAPDQCLILTSFEEVGWQPRIDNPLPPQPGRNSKQRLHNAIQRLNRRQINRLLAFSGDGTGCGICWRYVKNETPDRNQIGSTSEPDRNQLDP